MLSHKNTISQHTVSPDDARILIVDDDPDILEAIKDILELEITNCSVELASNAAQAKFLTEEFKPDIALLDIKLGQDNGLDLLPALQRINKNIACIMMTAYRDNKYTVRAVRFGANDYIYKPIDSKDLIKTIKRLLYSQALKKEIALAENRFRSVFEQTLQWLFLLDKNGYLIDTNETALNFIGENKKSVTNKFFWDTPWWQSSPLAQDNIRSCFSKAITGEIVHAELNIWKNEQEWKIFELSMKSVPDGETASHQIIVECWDITSRKKSEEEIKLLNKTLEKRVQKRTLELEQSLELLKEENAQRKKAEKKAEKANQTKSEFLSCMSHELRTPMNAILGFGQLLKMDSDSFNDTHKSNINEILIAGRHLLDLIDEVLDLSKIESGKMKIDIDNIYLDDTLKQCISLCKTQIKVRQLKIIDNISGNDYIVQADATRLKQVLLNLLSNAIKYNDNQGTITLDAETTSDGFLRIKITDTGIGLNSNEIARLFTPFDRLKANDNIQGTGIGLVISKQLIELMGGSIGVESIPNKGSTFCLTLKSVPNA